MNYTDKISDLLTSIADSGREFLNIQRGKSKEIPTGSIADSCRELLTSVGEASGTALARDVVEAYLGLKEADKLKFFEMLRTDFSSDPAQVLAAADGYRANPTEANLQALSEAVEPPRQELFRRLNMAPGGTVALVRLRADLQRVIKSEMRLRAVDVDLKHLLTSWFNRGFLQLHRIDWQTPAVVLEKLIKYEAVHEIRGWDDLRRRLEDDRRCFGFFHPALPEEPLIFVEVALVNGISPKVQPLIDTSLPALDPMDADTAVFYSISNCQTGLRGISFGNFLIKQVVAEIMRDLPNIRAYSTLSPIPGFRNWLDRTFDAGDLDEIQVKGKKVRDIIDDHSWIDEPAVRDALETPLVSLCAHYLVTAKSRGTIADPVARFHLNNGARLERINWLGDTSVHGLTQSAGMMVNYLYRPDSIIRNHEAFARKGKIITSSAVRDLVKLKTQGQRKIRDRKPKVETHEG